MFALKDNAAGLIEGVMYQPLFLYESITNTLVFVIIYFLIPNIKQIKCGVIGSSYFLLYGIIRYSLEPLRYDAFNFTGTYIINGILMAMGLILMIIAQFIAPKKRQKQVIYKFYCYHIRLNYLKFLKLIKSKSFNQYNTIDPDLTNLGFKEKPNFIRNDEQMLYYGPNKN